MYEHFREAAFPDSYAREQINCLTNTLAMRRSVRVAGLSGMGKSNLLRFLVCHPQLVTQHPDMDNQAVQFLYLDCNRLNPINALNFYRECHFLLQPESVPTSSDEQLLVKQLAVALQQMAPETFVIMVLDRAEELYEAVEPTFFGQLRNLRDEARAGRMMFIFGSSKPVGDLYELEKLFSDTCWVGPLAEGDGPDFFQHHQERLKLDLPPEMQQTLWDLTGGHPGLLKNSLEWLKRQGKRPPALDSLKLKEGLLKYTPIQNYCHRLWAGLSQAEQTALLNLSNRPHPLPEQLHHSGLLKKVEGRWQIFSPLWQHYLQKAVWSQEPARPLKISLDPLTRQVTLHWQGQTRQLEIKRKLVFALLAALAITPGQVCTKDDLINTLYGADKGQEMYDDPLFQLVTALRRSLDPAVRKLCPALKESCLKNVRGVGYRLLIDLPLT